MSGKRPIYSATIGNAEEVLVRAASNRWGDDADDVAQRKIWGPWLKELSRNDETPIVRLTARSWSSKLRSTEAPRSSPLSGRPIAITVRSITEPLAEELFGKDFVSKAVDGAGSPDSGIGGATR